MRKLVLAIIAIALSLSSASPQGVVGCGIAVPTSNLDGLTDCMPGIPYSPASAGPPPTCSPGSPTGQMDFSVCSNIAITAAL